LVIGIQERDIPRGVVAWRVFFKVCLWFSTCKQMWLIFYVENCTFHIFVSLYFSLVNSCWMIVATIWRVVIVEGSNSEW
jgi:hypothetical protein